MTDEDWATHAGLPTRHAIQSAIHVALVLGATGAKAADAHESYWRRAGGGIFAPPDLHLGEGLLLDLGLVVRDGSYLIPTTALKTLLSSEAEDVVQALCVFAIDRNTNIDPERLDLELRGLITEDKRRAEILAHHGRLFDDEQRKAIGTLGEEIVVQAARDELIGLGWEELAPRVRQVSLHDDTAGYDVEAPKIAGLARLLEVKATTVQSDPVVVHLSRNEYEVGCQNLGRWALTVVIIESLELRQGQILGWMYATSIEDQVPLDRPGGSWEGALLRLPRAMLIPGIPTAAA